MKIIDRVYGETEITEPVLLELIESKPIQRLKNIAQAGISKYVMPCREVTRYEHSIGVMILLKKLGASIQEQIAGLLHDVPHTAFSHVIDFVFTSKDHSHEFHERFHEQIIMKSEIPSILAKFGFDIKIILDETNFPLLERSLPDLCADRLDYTLRDMTSKDGFDEKTNGYISSFIVHKNEIIMSNKETAIKLAEDFIMMNVESWSHPLEVALYQILADALKIALDNNILAEDDLFTDDMTVYSILKNSDNQEIKQKLFMLNPNLEVVEDEKDYNFKAYNKVRYIDPKFLDSNNVVKRASEVSKEFAEKIKKHTERFSKGHSIKIIKY